MDCSKDGCKELEEPTNCNDKVKPTVEGESPMAHTFSAKDGNAGRGYTVMAWVKCQNLGGGSWANVWHLSKTNKNTPRMPSLYFHLGGRYFHACGTNRA